MRCVSAEDYAMMSNAETGQATGDTNQAAGDSDQAAGSDNQATSDQSTSGASDYGGGP